MKKKEWIILFILIVVGVIFVFVARFNTPSTRVEVYYHDELVLTFQPDENNTYFVEGDVGGLEIEVKDNSWHVMNEKCPDHLCSKMGWKTVDDIEPIVCMPNIN